MKKIDICCMMCMLMLGIGGCSWKQNQDMAEHSESFFAMDTYMTFTAYGADAEPAVMPQHPKILCALRMFSDASIPKGHLLVQEPQ